MSFPAQVLAGLNNVLFATDFSDCSRLALPYVRAIARLYETTVHIVHVIPPEPATAVPMDVLPAALDTVRAAAETTMAEFVGSTPLAGLPHRILIERGSVWEVLASLIQQEAIDLVVLGTHGRRGFRKLVLGSVAECIFRQAACPVLTVGPRAQPARLVEGKFGRILYTTDFSSGSLHAFPLARSLAERSGASLTLLHVVQDTDHGLWRTWRAARGNAWQRMEELLPPEARQRLRPEIAVERGLPAELILKLAEQGAADLIVMGTRRARRPAAAAHLPWAIASEVVALAPCPVLTVRDAREPRPVNHAVGDEYADALQRR